MTVAAFQTLFLLGAICLVIGALLGWVVASLRGGKNEETAENVQVKPAEPAKAALLQLLRGSDPDSLQVELGGKLHSNAEELSPEERKMLADLLKATAVWAKVAAASPAPQVSSAVPVPSAPVLTMERRNTGPLNPAVVQDPGSEVVRPNVLNGMTTVLANAINPAPVKKEEPKSIVQQIDEILQDKLLTSDLTEQKIGLLEDPRKGVLVKVGSVTYEGIGSVPEGAVKELLKASVQEWEKRQEIAKRRNG